MTEPEFPASFLEVADAASSLGRGIGDILDLSAVLLRQKYPTDLVVDSANQAIGRLSGRLPDEASSRIRAACEELLDVLRYQEAGKWTG